MPGRRVFPILLAIFALIPGAARATTMQQLDTRDLVVGSSEVVIGEVQGTRSYWNAAHTRILTDITLHVSRALKGEPGESLTLTQLGGEVDGVKVTVHGGPVFKTGEEALVFVWRDSRGVAQVNGLGQGKFGIRRDPDTGEKRLERAPGLAPRDARTLGAVSKGAKAAPLTLEALVREIQTVLAKEAGR